MDGGERIIVGDDGLARCAWAGSAPDYLDYHDTEWGVPVHGERALYERLTLEAFQSGLAWITILRKREGVPRGLRRLRPRGGGALRRRPTGRG